MPANQYCFVLSIIILINPKKSVKILMKINCVMLISLYASVYPKLGGLNSSRSPSAMSASMTSEAGGTGSPASATSGVKMRTGNRSRRPRPVSLATTGVMSSSMYEKRSHSNAATPTKPTASSCKTLFTFQFSNQSPSLP